jgi:hypothetical protein
MPAAIPLLFSSSAAALSAGRPLHWWRPTGQSCHFALHKHTNKAFTPQSQARLLRDGCYYGGLGAIRLGCMPSKPAACSQTLSVCLSGYSPPADPSAPLYRYSRLSVRLASGTGKRADPCGHVAPPQSCGTAGGGGAAAGRGRAARRRNRGRGAAAAPPRGGATAPPALGGRLPDPRVRARGVACTGRARQTFR